jgi:thiamine biosynthesis lipoprotein
VGDPPPGQKYYRVAVQDLAHPDRAAAYVKLRRASISTSGDTERYVIINGQRYSHIVDPTTGLGLTRRIGVTVISPDGTTSDWLTKPASILGPEKGLELIEATPGAAGRVVTIDGDQVHVYESRRWKEFVVEGEE